MKSEIVTGIKTCCGLDNGLKTILGLGNGLKVTLGYDKESQYRLQNTKRIYIKQGKQPLDS